MVWNASRDAMRRVLVHQFDSEIVMGIVEGIVSGMLYLHSSNPPILHNDLKTANILIGNNFSAKISDFGLCMKKKSTGFLGTAFWMAPELLNKVSALLLEESSVRVAIRHDLISGFACGLLISRRFHGCGISRRHHLF